MHKALTGLDWTRQDIQGDGDWLGLWCQIPMEGVERERL